ncbi:MAG: hypothetical protein U9R75_05565 [Candidatus Thermoplasmatota archaeon]|nr:hypothetical protein [Candidatus Thermoplasmatota archaeon]
MKGIRLADRERGSEFSRFERRLIFEEAYSHVGYVKYLDSRHFTLRKSLFTDIDTGSRYRLPDGMSVPPDEGSFIEVDPGGKTYEVRMGRKRKPFSLQAEGRAIIEVGSFTEARVPLASPNIPVDEFLSKVSSNWRNPEDDLLDMIIGLTIVSAPSSVYGKGGLGSEGIGVTGMPGRGTPRDVSNSIISMLPVEFRTSGSRTYRYHSVNSLKGMIQMDRAKVKEDCYSIIRPRRLKEAMKGRGPPVQLPFVINNASLLGRDQEFDLDVLDYQLTALYVPPPPEKVVEELALSTVKRSHEEAFFDMPGIGEPDAMAAVKLGLAVTRLHIGKQFTGTGFSRTRTDPSRGREIMEELLKRGNESVRDRIKEEELFSKRSELPWRSRLKPLDKRIYYRLRSNYEESGVQDLPIEKVLPDESRPLVEDSLERLNRYGYILFMKGGTMIKVIVGSSPEDLE